MRQFAAYRMTRLIAVVAAVCTVMFGGVAMAQMQMPVAGPAMSSMMASMCDACDMHDDHDGDTGAACDVACASACAILQPETAVIATFAPYAPDFAPRAKPERAGPPEPYPPKSA